MTLTKGHTTRWHRYWDQQSRPQRRSSGGPSDRDDNGIGQGAPGVIDARPPHRVVAAVAELDSTARERDSEMPLDQQQQGRSCFVGDPALAFITGGLCRPLDLDRIGMADVVFVRKEMAEKPTARETSVDVSVAGSPLGSHVISASMPTIPVPIRSITNLLSRSVDEPAANQK